MAVPFTSQILLRLKDKEFTGTIPSPSEVDIDSQSNGYSVNKWKNIESANPDGSLYNYYVEPYDSGAELVKGTFCTAETNKPLRTTYLKPTNTQYLHYSAPSLVNSTIAIAGKFNTLGSGLEFLFGGVSISSNALYFAYNATGKNFIAYRGSTLLFSSNALTTSQLNDRCVDYLIVNINGTLGTYEFIYNGDSLGSGSFAAWGFTTSSSNLLFRQSSILTNYYNEPISEIIIWQNPLGSSDIETLKNYLFTEYLQLDYEYNLEISSWDFGDLAQGTSYPSKLVQINNTGRQSLTFTFTNSTNFYVSQTSITVAANSSSSITIFAKTDNLGLHNENIIFNETNAGNTNFGVSSNILSIFYSYSLNPTSKDFGTVVSGSTEPSQVVTITNTGNRTLNFTFTNSTNFYTLDSPLSIVSGGTANITIYGRTSNIGIHNENIIFNETNAGNTNFPAQINVLTPPVDPVYSYSLNPTSKDFGTVVSGSTEPSQLVNITNTGNRTLNFTFTNSTNFYTSNSSLSVASGTTSSITIFAKTDNLGLHNENIIFNETNAGNTNFGVSSNIIEFVIPFVVTPQEYDFGTLFSGSTEPFITVTIQNNTGDGDFISLQNGSEFYWSTSNLTLTSGESQDVFLFAKTNNIGTHLQLLDISSFISGDIIFTASSEVVIAPPIPIVPDIPFCSLENPYTVVDSLGCNNDIGQIIITDYLNYSPYYTFELIDVTGGTFTIDSSGNSVFLKPNYYFLNVIPISGSFRDTCTFDWIAVDDAGSSDTIISEIIRNYSCGGFNVQFGRAVLSFSNAGFNYTYTLYESQELLIETGSGSSSSDLVIEKLRPDNYYLVLSSTTSNCTTTYSFFIDQELPLSVPNIQEIYITEWSSSFDWDNWSTANDPDYYAPLDTLEYQSTKIASYPTGLTWYSILTDPQNVSFDQTLSKVRQGFIFDDVLTIGIPFNDTSKWNALKTLLGSRWVVVFKDNNGNWWTFGYKNGAQAEDYTFGSELGGFTLGLKAVSENKIITAIDEQWVIDNIL